MASEQGSSQVGQDLPSLPALTLQPLPASWSPRARTRRIHGPHRAAQREPVGLFLDMTWSPWMETRSWVPLGEDSSSPKLRRLLPGVATRMHAHTPGSSPTRTMARSRTHAAPLPPGSGSGETGSRRVCTCVHARVRGQGGRGKEPEPAPEAPLSPPQTFQLSQPEPSFIL